MEAAGYDVTIRNPTERSHIGYDLDADVTASPNYIIGILDPAAPDFFSRVVPATFPNRVYQASTVARDRHPAMARHARRMSDSSATATSISGRCLRTASSA
jgi:hypothetical protein